MEFAMSFIHGMLRRGEEEEEEGERMYFDANPFLNQRESRS